ncbi:uncharacterized protein RSE6_01423 [Rhynchosporium secalis]|uniref:Uncharacterized protein n=1 Tax=Rhynchosporium secalis TaxID=38038 RepID=A0A1E1LXS1_RHYSE|nr:uncharacterized protein RSE6_01423 [Rhynchosporium secalis]
MQFIPYAQSRKVSPFEEAIGTGSHKGAEFLMERDDLTADVDERGVLKGRYLLCALKNGSADTIDYLVKHPKIGVTIAKYNGSLLWLAVRRGDPEILDMLLTHPDLKVNDLDGFYKESPLMLAARFVLEKIIRSLLLHKDIDLGLRDNHDLTAKDIAQINGNPSIIKLLQEKMAQ